MPLPACFRLADDVFPRVRAETARRLVAKGWSQSRTAASLDVSQAMVSKYLGRPGPEADPLVLRLADELESDLQDPRPRTTGTASPWCAVVPAAGEPEGAQEALQDLLAAERVLTQNPPLQLVPEIGLNMARAASFASTPSHVLSFPGRLVAAGDRLVSPVAPAWGASNHLAACLLALRRQDPSAHALANVRASNATVAAAREQGIAVFEVQRNGRTDDAPILDAFAAGHKAVHDHGAVGLEACLYLAGNDAVVVAQTIHSIHHRLTP